MAPSPRIRSHQAAMAASSQRTANSASAKTTDLGIVATYGALVPATACLVTATIGVRPFQIGKLDLYFWQVVHSSVVTA